MLPRYKHLFEWCQLTKSWLCSISIKVGDYGQRAHEALIVTRGQGFRKEKNKKKKGSYRGGEITVCDFILD